MIDDLRALLRARLATVVAFALASAAPRLAEACSVCSFGREEESQAAFIGTTVFLSILPLAMVGGVIWWLRRRLRIQAGVPRRKAVTDPDTLPALERRTRPDRPETGLGSDDDARRLLVR